MINRVVIPALLAAASASAFAAPAFPIGFRAPVVSDREIVLAGGMRGGAGGMGGMGGGNFGGMASGAGGMGGMAGGAGGMAGGMGGGNFRGGQSAGLMSNPGSVDGGSSGTGAGSDNYTYQYPQHITHGARHGSIRALSGDTTAQLNRQELARHRSAAETPDNDIVGFFRSLFH